jgi:hypothetical protein
LFDRPGCRGHDGKEPDSTARLAVSRIDALSGASV